MVSPINAWELKAYFVQPAAETQAVLETTPAPRFVFNPKSGRVAACERHGGQPWVITDNTAAICKALSPPIPAGTASQVICIGQFGGGPGPGKPPEWRSDIYKPGVHVIVFNQYNRPSDIGDGKRVSYNTAYLACAQVLASKYSERTVLVKCGLGGDIQKIADLPAYLAGLTPPVANNSVVTYDTLGHGGVATSIIQGKMETCYSIECARSGDAELDIAGKAEDNAVIGAMVPGPPATMHFMPIPAYANILSQFLRTDAIVNLCHCFTGDHYDFFTSPDPPPQIQARPAIASQLKAVLPAGMVVTGISGTADFYTSWEDLNKDKTVQLDEVTAWVPKPFEAGVWVVP